MIPVVLEDGFDSALQWSDAIADERLRSGAVAYLLRDLSRTDPEGAAQALLAVSDAAGAQRAVEDVADALAGSDLNEAVRWTESLSPDLRGPAAEGVIMDLAREDPQRASQWLDSLSSSLEVDGAIQRFVWTARQSEPQLAADWVGRLTEPSEQTRMYRAVLGSWLKEDNAAATTWIESADLPADLGDPQSWGQRRGR